MIQRISKRFLSLLLVAVMVLALAPAPLRCLHLQPPVVL